MVADDAHALFFGITRHLHDIEIGIGGGEIELAAVAEPGAVPAQVPAFDQDPAKAVFGGEIDVPLGVFRGRAVLLTACPAAVIEVHFPPDADILVRREPAHIAELVGLVEVEDDIALEQALGAACDLDRAPRRGEGAFADYLGTARRRRQLGAEARVVHAAQPHARIVDQCRLVEREVQAIVEHHGDRRVHGRKRAHRGLRIEIFIAIPVACGDRPGLAIGGNIELGQFLRDAIDGLALRLREFDAEAQAIVEHTHAHGNLARVFIALAEGEGQFVVNVLHPLAFTPGLLPSAGVAFLAKGDHFEIAAHRVGVGEGEAEVRLGDDRHAVARDFVIGNAFAVRVERYRDAPVGRGDRFRLRRSDRQERGTDEEGDMADHVSVSRMMAAKGGRAVGWAPLIASSVRPSQSSHFTGLLPKLKRQRRRCPPASRTSSSRSPS